MTEIKLIATHIRERFYNIGFNDAAKFSSNTKCILDFLCRRLRDNPSGNKCYPSIPEISKEESMPERCVKRAIKELKDKNIISVTQRKTGTRNYYRLSDDLLALFEFLVQNNITKRGQIGPGKFFTGAKLALDRGQIGPRPGPNVQNHSLYNNQKDNQKDNQRPSGVSASHVSSERAYPPKSPQKPPERRSGKPKGNSWKDSEPKQAYAYHKAANEQLEKYREYDLKYKTDKFLNGRGVIENEEGVPPSRILCDNRDYKNNRDYHGNLPSPGEGEIDIEEYQEAQKELWGNCIYKTVIVPIPAAGVHNLLNQKNKEIIDHIAIMRARRKGAVNA